jgi:translation initiation factor IF-1
MATVWSVGPLVAATARTEAMIGPTHGAHTSPTAAPVAMTGDPKVTSRGMRLVNRSPNAGTARHAPKKQSTSALAARSRFVEKPATASAEATTTDSVTKVAPNPITNPSARRRPPSVPRPSTNGTIGKVQGARIVRSPATNANARMSSIPGRPYARRMRIAPEDDASITAMDWPPSSRSAMAMAMRPGCRPRVRSPGRPTGLKNAGSRIEAWIGLLARTKRREG